MSYMFLDTIQTTPALQEIQSLAGLPINSQQTEREQTAELEW